MENSKQPINGETSVKAYTPHPMRLYRFAVGAISGLVRFLLCADIKGRENVPTEGAFFACGNHISNWDPVLMAIALKRPVHFMGKVELFRVPVLGKLLCALGAFPVDRDAVDIGAIKTALTHIKHDEPLGIFPQGKRYRGTRPETRDIKSGVGMMVYRTHAPVVPVAIYTKDYKIRLFRRVHVRVGKPIEFDEFDAGAKSPEEYQRISEIIFDRVRALDESVGSETGKDA